MKVPGKFNMQAHPSGSILVYVCVLNGHSSSVDPNATALRNQGKCHGNIFQGVPGGGFQDRSKCEHLPLAVNVNNTSYTQEMSEKVLPGGHWRKVPGKFQMQALTNPCEREQECITGHVTERSSRGSLDEYSGQVQNASTHSPL